MDKHVENIVECFRKWVRLPCGPPKKQPFQVAASDFNRGIAEKVMPLYHRGVAQFGRVLGLGPRCRRFESCRLDQLTFYI